MLEVVRCNRARARQLVAAGFTIAPLQPRFTGGGASGECLVTLVLKVDDLGGWLSAARLGALVQPWLRSVLAEAAAGAVIALRDKVRALQGCLPDLSVTGRGGCIVCRLPMRLGLRCSWGALERLA